MNRFIQIHWGLIQYIKAELKKKKTTKEILLFLKATAKKYFQVMIAEYKRIFLLFDIEYQKQKKSYDKVQSLKLDLQRALKMLHYIDDKFVKQGWNRQQRRTFWREFFKDGNIRQDTFAELEKELK